MPKLNAQPREVLGKQVRALRKSGQLPAVLYGPAVKKTESLTVSLRDFEKLWREAGESTIIDLSIDGRQKKVLIHEVEFDRLSDKPIHVDFYAVDISKPVRVNVPFKFTGEAPAVKLGGVLLKLLHEVEIEVLPMELPHDLEVDLSALNTFEDRITLRDITLSGNIRLTEDENVVVAFVEPPRVSDEAEEEKPEDIDFDKIEESGKKGKEEEKTSAEEQGPSAGKPNQEKPSDESR